MPVSIETNVNMSGPCLCQDESSAGEALFTANTTVPQEDWVVLDRMNQEIFAPLYKEPSCVTYPPLDGQKRFRRWLMTG